MKMEQTECSETSAIKHHTPGDNKKYYKQHSEHGESLTSTTISFSESVTTRNKLENEDRNEATILQQAFPCR
jgi:hypothetical protein